MLINDLYLHQSLIVDEQNRNLTKYNVEKFAENFLKNLPKAND